jgi:hypothetical protein
MSSAELLPGWISAQAPDLHVDRAVVDLVVVQAREPEELVSSQRENSQGAKRAISQGLMPTATSAQ